MSAPILRPFVPGDLDRVSGIESRIAGRSRKRFLETRLALSASSPEEFLTCVAVDGETPVGYGFARLAEGDGGESRGLLGSQAILERRLRQPVARELMDDARSFAAMQVERRAECALVTERAEAFARANLMSQRAAQVVVETAPCQASEEVTRDAAELIDGGEPAEGQLQVR